MFLIQPPIHIERGFFRTLMPPARSSSALAPFRDGAYQLRVLGQDCHPCPFFAHPSTLCKKIPQHALSPSLVLSGQCMLPTKGDITDHLESIWGSISGV